VTTPDLDHGWQLTGSSADAYEPLLAPSGRLDVEERAALVADLEDVLEPYVDDDGLALPIESHVALAAAS
jgi:hypothetical protein